MSALQQGLAPKPSRVARSAAQYARARNVLPDGNTRHTVFFEPHPIYAVRGKGARVVDVDGNAYLDCVNNYSALIHGHCHPVVVEAVVDKVRELASVGLPTAAEIDLAAMICERMLHVEEVRFVNSGTEAVMLAIKAARAYTGRPRIAKLEGAYHGCFDAAEVSQAPAPANWGPRERPESVPVAHGTPAGVLENTIVLPFDDVEGARGILLEQAESLAAVLIDAAPSHIGFLTLSPEYLKMLREVTRSTGCLFILDEVYSFRFGVRGIQERLGIAPDLTVLGKIIGGGFPVGAVGGSRDLMAVFARRNGSPRLPHGGTYNANPITMTAGQKTLELFDDHAWQTLERLGAALRAGLEECVRTSGFFAQVTGLGSVAALQLNAGTLASYRDTYVEPERRQPLQAFHAAMLREGVLIDPRGTIVLSTAMSRSDIDEFLDKALKCMRELAP